jgi:hypothetical protein
MAASTILYNNNIYDHPSMSWIRIPGAKNSKILLDSIDALHMEYIGIC